MKSKTKYAVEDTVIKKIFNKAELGQVAKISALEAGEFNSAYFVTADGKEYVLKIAPKNNNNTLTYESNLMQQEVYFYKLIAEQTDVSIPKVYCYDDSKTLLPSAYFIMEKLQTKPLTECQISAEEKKEVYANVGEILAKLHNIKGQSFGYCQNQLYENWYLAIQSMVKNIIADCRNKNKKCKGGNELLNYIERYKDVLLKVQPTYVHFDLWDGNIFYGRSNGRINLSIIDTERGFWGDSIGDFVSVEMFKNLSDKLSVKSYNNTAINPITCSRDEEIRFNILRAYLGLIVYTEKFVRYTKFQVKYFINYVLAKQLLKTSFKALKKHEQ